MDAPDTLITVPNGNGTIDKKCKYIVLQDFWLKDICLKQGQIITDPVSKRWIDLRLIKPYCVCKCHKSEIANISNLSTIESDLESDIVSVTDAVNDVDTIETEQPRKRRGRPPKMI